MKKLVAMLALLCAFNFPVAAQDGFNPSAEQIDQAIQQLQKAGFDTSQLPNKEAIKQQFSGENGRRMQEMAKKMQEKHPEQFQQMQQKLQQHFDKNGDGTLDPSEREHARQAFQQRQGDQGDQAPGSRLRPGDQPRDRADRNDDGQVGPRERDAAKEVRQQHQQQGDDQNTIRLKRRSDGPQSRQQAAANPDVSHRNGAPPQVSDRSPRSGDGQQLQHGHQTRANLPQSQQTRNSDRPAFNQRAGNRGSRTSGGDQIGGPSSGGPHHGGAAGGGHQTHGGR